MEISLHNGLPLFAIGSLSILFSVGFCCYLYRLRKLDEKITQKTNGFKKVICKPKSKIPNDACVVCLETFYVRDNIAVTKCNHAFHSKCLNRWLLRDTTCPLCKTVLKTVVDTPRTSHFSEIDSFLPNSVDI